MKVKNLIEEFYHKLNDSAFLIDHTFQFNAWREDL